MPDQSESLSPRKRPRQERSRQTVEAILDAAAEVFEAHGLDGGTTERIVERAGVSVGSMYQYFPNKRALLAALAERSLSDARRHQDAFLAHMESADPPLDEAVRRLIDYLKTAHEAQPRLKSLMFEEMVLPGCLAAEREAFGEALWAGVAGLLARRGIPDPDVKARVLISAVTMLVHQFVLHPRPELPPEQAVEEVFRLSTGYLRVFC